ncbi:MAG: hypothetical protein AB7P04_04240 [Bacteriovoracia bacterium]
MKAPYLAAALVLLLGQACTLGLPIQQRSPAGRAANTLLYWSSYAVGPQDLDFEIQSQGSYRLENRPDAVYGFRYRDAVDAGQIRDALEVRTTWQTGVTLDVHADEGEVFLKFEKSPPGFGEACVKMLYAPTIKLDIFPGDYNEDRVVDDRDAVGFYKFYDFMFVWESAAAEFDFNHDGKVDDADFSSFGAIYNTMIYEGETLDCDYARP